ncbi:MAG: hypothetical protein U0T82_16820 [Bacteroidales bacterium]
MDERTKKQKELVETLGQIYEKEGFPPIAGRILGLLIVSDKEKFTFDEIIEELQISKGSASTAIRMLELQNGIEYITLPGDRKRYFRLKKADRFSLVDEYKSKLERSQSYLQMVLDLKADKHSDNAEFIRDMIGILSFFKNKFDELKHEYLSRN